MTDRILICKQIEEFEVYLQKEEKSENTIKKYMRDVYKFKNYITDLAVTKELVISYKAKLIADEYAIRSINSMLASLNCLWGFLEWEECKIKTIRVQSQTFYSKKKNLLKKNIYVLL